MLSNLMNARVDIYRATYSPDASGGQTSTTTAVYSSQPCSVQPMSDTWKVLFLQRQIVVTHTLWFNTVLTVLKQDEIHFGSRRFIVQGTRDLISSGRAFAVDCREVL